MRAKISLEAMEAQLNEWNAERRRSGMKHFYYIKRHPNGHWEVRETF